jgi:uncharacterized membrane protein YfcA
LGWWLAGKGWQGSTLVELVLSNSLALTLLTGILGWGLWLRKGVKTGWDGFVLGLPSALTAVSMAHLVRQGGWYQPAGFRWVFGLMLGLVLFRNAHRLWSESRSGTPYPKRALSKLSLPGLGAVAGVFSALSGLGGGAIMVPVLQRWGYRDQGAINALSMGSIALMAGASTLYYAMIPSDLAVPLGANSREWVMLGRLIPAFLIPCALGTLLGLIPGIALAEFMSSSELGQRRLRWALLVFLVLVLGWMNRSCWSNF